MVLEALNNHMTSACGLVRLGVGGLGVRGGPPGALSRSHGINALRGYLEAKCTKPLTMRDALPFMPGAGIAYIKIWTN